jgi:hypothetical protein
VTADGCAAQASKGASVSNLLKKVGGAVDDFKELYACLASPRLASPRLASISDLFR